MSLSIIAAALVLQVTAPASPPPTAKAVLETAQAQAKKEKKNVYVMFTASWCGWCKKHYEFMEQNKSFYDKNFVTVHIDVMENGDKKSLENAGGMEYLTKWKGGKSGIPYLVVLNPKGEVLGNSLMDQKDETSNIGHPVKDEEIAAYMKVLEKGAVNAKKADLDKLKKNLDAQEGR